MRVIGVLGTGVIVVALILSPLAVAAPPEREAVTKANNASALDFYGKLKEKPGNIFFSPYSISTALAMTYAGARGNTEAQMAKALRFELGQSDLHPAMGQLIAELNAAGKQRAYELVVANALWGQKGYNFLPDFLKLTQTHYGAGLNEVDFIGATEEARKTINAWVEQKTKNKIQDLIKPGLLNELTRLVLTNAIYFKGNWACKFDPKLTQNADFATFAGKAVGKVQTPMMYQMGSFKYAWTEDMQVLDMPYVGKELSMTIFLPSAVSASALNAFENSLTVEKFNQLVAQTREHKDVHVYVPKFKMICEFTLNDPLKQLGMTDAFDPDRADFSGMNGRKDLFISAAVHKAFVDVNEEGTEAAAATGIVVGVTSMPMEPLIFRADHPFIFAIRHNPSGSILFVGRVMDPR